MKKLLFSVVTLSLVFAFPVSAETLKMVYFNNYAPYSWLDNGQIKGILIDVIQAVGDELDIEMEHEGYPWKRAQFQVENGTSDAFITTKTADRAKYTNQGNVPIIVARWTLFIPKGSSLKNELSQVKTLDGLRRYSLVDYIGDGWGMKNTPKSSFNINETVSFSSAINMLSRGRVDAFVQNSVVTWHIARKEGVQDKIEEINTVFENAGFYFQVGKNSAFSGITDKVDTVLIDLKTSGVLEKIYNHYQQ